MVFARTLSTLLLTRRLSLARESITQSLRQRMVQVLFRSRQTADGVRNTAAGLRYVIYAFATALDDPSKVIAEPSGMLIGPRDWERVGDVSNVVFTNGAIEKDGNVYIYYAASDTRLHVASTTVDKLIDYVFSTPSDPGRSVLCVQQRCDLIRKNLEYINKCKEEE